MAKTKNKKYLKNAHEYGYKIKDTYQNIVIYTIESINQLMK